VNDSTTDVHPQYVTKALVQNKADLVTATANATPARLGVGSNGQVLKANSATATGLEWAADLGIPATLLDAKGDLIVATAADTAARLAVGTTNGHVLQVDSSTSTGLKWDAAPSGGFDLIATATPSGASTVEFTSISTSYKTLVCYFYAYQSTTSGVYFNLRFNDDSGSTAYAYQAAMLTGTTWSQSRARSASTIGASTGSVVLPTSSSSTNLEEHAIGAVNFHNSGDTTRNKLVSWNSTGFDGSSYVCSNGFGIWKNTANAITKIAFIRTSTQTITGTFYLYGAK
jgi:hypothetical protein